MCFHTIYTSHQTVITITHKGPAFYTMNVHNPDSEGSTHISTSMEGNQAESIIQALKCTETD